MNLPSPAGLSRSHVRCPGCISWVGDGCVASRALSSRRSLTARPRMHGARAALTETVQHLLSTASRPHPGLAVGASANTAVFTAGLQVLLKGLTPAGVLHSWFLGTSVYAAFGWGAYILVCLYFLLGSAVTRVKLKQKQAEGIAEARSGRRQPGSVWGSGLAGAACAITALVTGQADPWQAGFVASFVSKLSDTVSSEIGKAYGKRAFLITTFKEVPRGTEGAVSLEGTAAGMLAALGFAGLSLVLGQVCAEGAVIVALAAIVANLAESMLGAVLQGRQTWLNNDAVNMLQICFAAALAVLASGPAAYGQ